MNSLIEFKSNFLVYPFGLYNNSIICYFNSLIQTLFSCTSITEYLLYNEEKFKNNIFLKIYIKIIKKYIENSKCENNSNFLVENENLILFNEFLRIIKIKKNDNRCNAFGHNQEDSGELLILLLDLINDNYINNLFMHKYKCDIYCKECKNIIQIKNDNSIFFDLDIDAINENYLKYTIDNNLSNMNKYIRNNYSNISDYICIKCKKIESSIFINRLTLIPTIIVINLNKYITKVNYIYPLELKFKNKSENICYKYKLISTINHSGTQNYGHYVTKAIRKNHEYKNSSDKNLEIYLLNDTSYIKDNFRPNANTYLLFYHYFETIEFHD